MERAMTQWRTDQLNNCNSIYSNQNLSADADLWYYWHPTIPPAAAAFSNASFSISFRLSSACCASPWAIAWCWKSREPDSAWNLAGSVLDIAVSRQHLLCSVHVHTFNISTHEHQIHKSTSFKTDIHEVCITLFSLCSYIQSSQVACRRLNTEENDTRWINLPSRCTPCLSANMVMVIRWVILYLVILAC